MSVPCHQAAAECLCPSWGSRAHACDSVCRHLRGCVCFNARVDTHTHGGCEWSWFRTGLPAQLVRHWPPPEWSRSPTTGRMRWVLQRASLIPGRWKEKKDPKGKRPNATGMISLLIFKKENRKKRKIKMEKKKGTTVWKKGIKEIEETGNRKMKNVLSKQKRNCWAQNLSMWGITITHLNWSNPPKPHLQPHNLFLQFIPSPEGRPEFVHLFYIASAVLLFCIIFIRQLNPTGVPQAHRY